MHLFECVLLVNAIWDFMCAASILSNSNILSYFSTAHTHLWKQQTDRENNAATHLMAYLVLCWGCMRLAAAVMGMWRVALFSYLLEALVFACEAVLFGTMHYGQAMAVSLASLALALWALLKTQGFIVCVNTRWPAPIQRTAWAKAHTVSRRRSLP
jgi:hypothetical protein